ncbi:MAG: SCO family protein, partial [Phenylobacterium sp.]
RMLAILALLALALAILTGLAVRRGVLGPQDQTAAVGGPFQMVDQAGATVDQRMLKGKWSAVFFGFTYCPDACPTTLFALGQAEKLLGPRAADFQTVFVSVDPGRDTPQQMKAYLANAAFPRATVGLTGSQAQVDQVARAYHVFHQKAGDGPGYVINHSTITYLMTPKGQFACFIPYGASPEQMAAKITTAMRAGPNATAC